MEISDINEFFATRKIRIELVKGKDYFIAIGADVRWADTTIIRVKNLNDLTFDEWVSRIMDINASHFRNVPRREIPKPPVMVSVDQIIEAVRMSIVRPGHHNLIDADQLIRSLEVFKGD